MFKPTLVQADTVDDIGLVYNARGRNFRLLYETLLAILMPIWHRNREDVAMSIPIFRLVYMVAIASVASAAAGWFASLIADSPTVHGVAGAAVFCLVVFKFITDTDYFS